jgi:1-deoxy-D-xylulose-5-phosphate reductoisomerase
MGGTAPVAANGANEAAVAAFLAEKIPFLRIGELVTQAIDAIPVTPLTCYEDVVKADHAAREFVAAHLEEASA